MTAFDVAIIGGGIAGCSAALHLRRRNASVLLLERRICGSVASGVNHGGVRRQGRHPAELPLAQRSRKLWSELPALIGTDGEFEASGHLKLARSEADMADLEYYAAKVSDFGLKLELLDRKAVETRYPWLGAPVTGGSLCAGDGQANPRLVSPAFARAARAAGALLHEGEEVADIAWEGRHFLLHTAKGTAFRARRLINAAGGWGASIAKRFGEPVPEDILAPNMAVTDPIPHFMVPNIGVCGGDVYIRQIARGNIIFGGGTGLVDRSRMQARPSAAVTTSTARLVVALVPRLAGAQIIRTWSGIEGLMPDGLPVLGRSGTTPGLVHGFGFSGHGFQLGPAVGAVLCELTLDGEATTPIGAFAIERFATPPCRDGAGHKDEVDAANRAAGADPVFGREA